MIEFKYVYLLCNKIIASSFSEFAVSTKILRNETLASRGYHGSDIKVSKELFSGY